MSNFAEINLNILIAFALFVIVFLLLYIAFGRSKKQNRAGKK